MQIYPRTFVIDARALLQHRKRLTSAQLIALSFALAILLGTFLLSLPMAHTPGTRVSVLNAFFTATSAICVTGLVVVDTGAAFNDFGKVVIMLLIQAGGLGIMTLGTLLALITGRRIAFRERMTVQAQMNAAHVGSVEGLIQRIILTVVAIELIGTLGLYWHFRTVEGADRGLFYALFHSISAFNNAGFAFYSDSLSQFVTNSFVNGVIIMLIILGGLGFTVIFELVLHVFRKQRIPLSLHCKLVLTSTAFLIGVGSLVFLIFEWTNPDTLGTLSFLGKLIASLFQSVTPRTAGFNTLDYGSMRGGTLVFTMLLMFIGGSPGSTAGGIKTVTFFVLVATAWRVSRGHSELTIFHRRIALVTMMRASVIALFGLMISGAGLTVLALTESHLDPFALAFEVISASGTVGLSLGITPQLTALGKLIVITLMYLGRLGPMTMALALIQSTPERGIAYPTEDVVIG